MRRALELSPILRVAVAWVALLGCGDAHEVSDAGPSGDAGPVGDAAPDSFVDARDAFARDAFVEPDSFFEPGPVRCGFTTCAEGLDCCFGSGECFDASDRSACMTVEPDSCVSNADCEPNEYCRSDSCLGSGTCAPRPEGCGRTVVCGCDGRNYESICQAAEFGVRVSHTGTLAGCGQPAPPVERIDCTSDAGCPDDGTCVDAGYCVYGTPLVACSDETACPVGMSCCALSGTCVRDDCEGCCSDLPQGTFSPCDREEDCIGFDHTAFCFRESCSGPGGCGFPPSSCGGASVPVCGCDGVTYTNVCWAQQERLSIVGAGECE